METTQAPLAPATYGMREAGNRLAQIATQTRLRPVHVTRNGAPCIVIVDHLYFSQLHRMLEELQQLAAEEGQSPCQLEDMFEAREAQAREAPP